MVAFQGPQGTVIPASLVVATVAMCMTRNHCSRHASVGPSPSRRARAARPRHQHNRPAAVAPAHTGRSRPGRRAGRHGATGGGRCGRSGSRDSDGTRTTGSLDWASRHSRGSPTTTPPPIPSPRRCWRPEPRKPTRSPRGPVSRPRSHSRNSGDSAKPIHCSRWRPRKEPPRETAAPKVPRSRASRSFAAARRASTPGSHCSIARHACFRLMTRPTARSRWLTARSSCSPVELPAPARSPTRRFGSRSAAVPHASKEWRTTFSDASSFAFAAPIPPRCCSDVQSSACVPPAISPDTQGHCSGAGTCSDPAASCGAAERDLRAGLAVGRIAGQVVLGWTEMNLGQVAMSLNDWPEARRHLAASRALLDSAHDRWGVRRRRRSSRRPCGGPCATGPARIPCSATPSDSSHSREIHRRSSTRACSDFGTRSRGATGRAPPRCWRCRVTPRCAGVRRAYVDLDYYDALLALGTGRPNDARRALDRSQRESARSGEGPTYLQLARAAEAEAQLGRLDTAEAKLRQAMSMFERYRATRETREQRLAALVGRRRRWRCRCRHRDGGRGAGARRADIGGVRFRGAH